MLLALRIDVDTLAGAREGVPRLVELLQSLEADATFFFSLGPDRSGQARGPAFRVGEYAPQQKQNLRAAGARGMARCYGTLLPAPLQATRIADIVRKVDQVGYETALGPWDRVNWVKRISEADEAWIKGEMDMAQAAYAQLVGRPAQAMAAPDWRCARAAFRLQQRMGLQYGSDCRGDGPFLPVVDGEPIAVPQLPTTLPTLAELIGAGGMGEQDAVAHLLALTAKPAASHVFRIHAGPDTGKRLPLLQHLLAAWKEGNCQLVSLRRLHASLDPAALRWHRVEQQAWPAYSGQLATQGENFPG